MPDQPPGPSLLRLPTGPYPGLRPFLDHEDMLMYGRQSQVADIARRLGGDPRSDDSDGDGDGSPSDGLPPLRFVAVIGGSGSGKSSLMRAGVVPFLRQYGIRDAGDLWETVVATPGTNFQPDADGVQRESPITRLAARFEQVLQGPADAARRETIAQTLRRPGGFGLLVEQYGAQLAMPPGVNPADANVLLLIDQFEELFHRTNAGSADAQALIERVIDHYHQARQRLGSPQCFVAITMRSEHLNDCAGWIGLPEAINRGGYLVGRLDDAQVREVIERPAQRYLRLKQRERQRLLRQRAAAGGAPAPALPPLPEAVVFEAGVVDRLVADTHAIAHDCDHLPLLQHALARLWTVATTREGLLHDDVPAAITLADLWHTAHASPGTALPAGQNLLRMCLDRWAERALQSHPADEQAVMQALLCRLAYKDTRTGSYNQQRLYVAGHPLGADALKRLLGTRWIDEVDYLYWDDADPQRVTLKVSHEAFIRGWQTLRALTDHEAWRLEQFTVLLTAAQRWWASGRRPADLLEQRALTLLQEAGIPLALWHLAHGSPSRRHFGVPGPTHDADPPGAQWQDWRAWLVQLPRGAALQGVSLQQARQFMRQSVLAAEKTHRLERRLWLGGGSIVTGLALLGLAGAAFNQMVDEPVQKRVAMLIRASELANLAGVSVRGQGGIGDNAAEVRLLLNAAALVQQTRSGEGIAFAAFSDWTLSWMDLPGTLAALPRRLPDTLGAIDPIVNRRLRSALTQTVWLAAPAAADAPAGDTAAAAENDRRLVDVSCSGLPGQALLPALDGGSRTNLRALFLQAAPPPAPPGQARPRLLALARMSQPDGQAGWYCLLGERLLTLDDRQQPQVQADENLTHLLLRLQAAGNAAQTATTQPLPARTTLSRLPWDDNDSTAPSNALAGVAPRLLAQVPASAAAAAASAPAGGLSAAGRSMRLPGGRVLAVDGQGWRTVARTAQRVVLPDGAAPWRALDDSQDDLACSRIGSTIARVLQSGTGDTSVRLFRDGEACLAVLRRPDTELAALQQLDRVQVLAFLRPTQAQLDDTTADNFNPALLASVDFGRVQRAAHTWLAGTQAGGHDFTGWLLLQRPQGSEPSGVPWSTEALRRLGEAVLRQHEAAAAAQPPAAGRPAPLPGRADWAAVLDR